MGGRTPPTTRVDPEDWYWVVGTPEVPVQKIVLQPDPRLPGTSSYPRDPVGVTVPSTGVRDSRVPRPTWDFYRSHDARSRSELGSVPTPGRVEAPVSSGYGGTGIDLGLGGKGYR